MIVLKYILLSLAIAVCLFYGMMKFFGWAHYHRWSFFITKTEAKLSGPWLDRYLRSHGLLAFFTAGWLFLYFFENLASYVGRCLIITAVMIIYNELRFKKIAADDLGDKEV